LQLANRAPALPGKNLMSLRHPSGYFTLHKVFSPMTRFGFGVWGTPGSRGGVGGVMLVLRTFPELAGRSVQNLVEIGLAVQTVSFIYLDRYYSLVGIKKWRNEVFTIEICSFLNNILL